MTTPAAERLTRPVLVFGGTGQVGRELVTTLDELGTVSAPGRTAVDLTRTSALREIIRTTKPALIINSAALTNVDQAERDPELARALNETAPGVMAEEASRAGALLVHYSTDYVFDGRATTPYEETDAPNPINVYGVSKLGGERQVARVGTPHLVIRTSWVYSRTGAGFVATFLRNAREDETIRVVSDQVGSPTWSRSLARATTAIVRSLRSGIGFHLPESDWGVYHLGGSGAASRLEIAREILEILAPERADGAPTIVPVSAAEFAAVAPRPGYSALANTRTERRFGVTLPPWREELARMLGDAVD
ncbi:MAG TPA: dTDP-4-dehydrorhamnose reductase [Gemmatimonadaceae bacterium]|nr:dTDP-4-dehydrorhamnose reductase [Gemmatimonadaceae bacterium]